ncbi:hypothetical protein Q7P37_002380 [Cladosporium fusiforme]
MPSPISSLPAELLSRIFEDLSDHRPDISACRLVNQRFHHLSSPYLITNVVLAKRLREIAKCHEVACHPYFSRHVTGLIYDVSYWDPYSAGNFDTYVDECESIEDSAVRRFCDEEWLRRVRAETEFYSSFFRNNGEPSLDAATRFFQKSERPLTKNDAQLDVELMDAMHDSHDDPSSIADRMGARQSFPIYKRYYNTHQQLDTNGEYGQIIRQAIIKFPKLRHVHFTDYRGLARSGECYNDLCTRLFGNVREPERWNNIEYTGEVTNEVITAWKIIMDVKGELRSLSFGPHPFEQRCNSTDPLAFYKESQFLAAEELKCDDSENNSMWEAIDAEDTEIAGYDMPSGSENGYDWARLFNGLRSLRLPLFIEESLPSPTEGLGREIPRMLYSMPDTLVHLALVAKGPIDGFIQHEDTPACLQTLEPFNDIVANLRLPRLQTLELEGWVTDFGNLRKFLYAHATTLRTLHLLNIFCCGDRWDEEEAEESDMWPFGYFVAKTMNLTGIEIYQFEHQRFPPFTSEDLEGVEQQSWLVDPLDTTPGDWDEEVYEDRQFDEGDDDRPHILDAPRLEKVCLAGRPNLVHRRVRPQHLVGCTDAPGRAWRGPGYYWTRRPAYW